MRGVFHGTFLMTLQCSSILCLLLLTKNHAFNNFNNKFASTFGTIKENSLTFLPRNRPTSSTVGGTYACTRLRQSASDKDTHDNLQQEDQTLSNVTTINDQQEQQGGTRFQRWAQRGRSRFNDFVQGGRSRFNDFVQGGRSLFHWRRRARNVTQTQQARHDDENSTDDDDVNDNGGDSSLTTTPLPNGPRWAISHPDIDLSGTWKPLVTKEFKKEYDVYLQNCGTNFAFRQLCLNFCSIVHETIQQEDQGRVLHLIATSPAGTWTRSLISSGADSCSESKQSLVVEDYQPIYTEFLDPDKELIKVEAWWQDQGRVHTSFLRNKPKVCGGEFESKRYLTTDEATGDVQLVCESIFHPSKDHLNQTSSSSTRSPFKPAFVRWKYQRV